MSPFAANSRLHAHAHLFPYMCASRKTPGIRPLSLILRDMHMHGKKCACACRRELAANGLNHVQRRFEDTVVLLKRRGFGIVYRGHFKKTRPEGLRNQDHHIGEL